LAHPIDLCEFVTVDHIFRGAKLVAGFGFDFDEDKGLAVRREVDEVDFAKAGAEISFDDFTAVFFEVVGGEVLAKIAGLAIKELQYRLLIFNLKF